MNLEGGSGFGDGLFDEVVGDLTGRMLVEYGIHQGDLGRTPARFRLRRTILSSKREG